MNKIKAWILRHIFKVVYSIGVDVAENSDYSCEVVVRHNLRTGKITIAKVTYF